MKTERRHELQTNDLADMLGKYVQQNSSQVKLITAGLLGAIAIGFAYFFISNQQSSRSGSSWIEFYAAAQTADDGTAMEVAAEKLKTDSAPGLWARQSLGDIKLSTGSAALYRDREQAEKDLKEAEAHYKAVLDGVGKIGNAASKKSLKTRATLGLAQVYESLGDPEAALKHYEEVKNAAQGDVLGELAAKHATRVASLKQKEWYAWFKEQQPATPEDLNLPTDLESLPDRPDLDFPGRFPSAIDPPESPLGPASPSGPAAPLGPASPSNPVTPDPVTPEPVSPDAPEKGAPPAKAGDAKDGQ